MTDEQKNQEPQAEPSKAGLTDQKKNALLRYMAVLFGVAFLLVALSFLIQIRDSRQTVSQLSQSNASALQNAEKLQDENRALAAKITQLQAQLDAAETETDTAEEALTKAEAEVKSLTAKLKESTASAKEALAATTALNGALNSRLNDDKDACRTQLKAIDPKRLDANSSAVYNELLAWVAQ